MFRANIAFASKMKAKLFQTKGVLTKRTCREGYTALGFIQSNCRGVAIIGQDTTHCSILIIKDRHQATIRRVCLRQTSNYVDGRLELTTA